MPLPFFSWWSNNSPSSIKLSEEIWRKQTQECTDVNTIMEMFHRRYHRELGFIFFSRLSHANISEPSTLITRAMQFVSPSCAEHQDVCMYVSREWRVSMWVYLSNPIKNPLNVPPFRIYKDRQYGIVMSLSVHQKKTCSVAVEFCTTGCLTLMLISKDCSAVGLDRGKARGTVS